MCYGVVRWSLVGLTFCLEQRGRCLPTWRLCHLKNSTIAQQKTQEATQSETIWTAASAFLAPSAKRPVFECTNHTEISGVSRMFHQSELSHWYCLEMHFSGWIFFGVYMESDAWNKLASGVGSVLQFSDLFFFFGSWLKSCASALPLKLQAQTTRIRQLSRDLC